MLINRMEVLMSIRNKWWIMETSVNKNDRKTIEVRKTAPISKDVEFPLKVYVYVPEIKAVAGFLMIESVTSDYPSKGYENETKLSVKDQETYSDGKKLYFWNIANSYVYEKPIPLSSFGIVRPPQSWQYISSNKKENTQKEFYAYLGLKENSDRAIGSVILFDKKNEEHHYQFNEDKPEDYKYANMMLLTAQFAINKAKELGCTVLYIYSEYKGISMLTEKKWSPNNEIAETFIKCIQQSGISVHGRIADTDNAIFLIKEANKIANETVSMTQKENKQWIKCNVISDKQISISARQVVSTDFTEESYINMNGIKYPAKVNDYIIQYMIAGCYTYGIMKENDFKRAFVMQEKINARDKN